MRWKKLFAQRRYSLGKKLTIAKKIGYGYSLAIGIAICGTAIGLAIGDYYQKQAQNRLLFIDEQQHLFNRLEEEILKLRLHPQRLIAVLDNHFWFEYETSKFLGEIRQVHNTLSELDSLVKNNHNNSLHLVVKPAVIKQFSTSYQNNIDDYVELMQSVWAKNDYYNLTPEKALQVKQQILEDISGEKADKISIEFEILDEKLTRMFYTIDRKKKEANYSLVQANKLRFKIVIFSMALAVLLATLLALYTSRAIARPLQLVTNIAQQVTKECNFNLQATVISQDEVGMLANSLNQLIQWVGKYTQELEESREFLEHKVEERTQELTQTLRDLKQTQAQLIQTEKMSSLGQTVAGVAHEINNPVSFIYGNLSHIEAYSKELIDLIRLYQKKYPNPEPEIATRIDEIELDFVEEDLSKIMSSMNMGTERIKAIVLSLRNFSRLDEAEVKEVDLHEGIENTLLILNHRLQNGFEVIKNYENLPFISCYPAQLNQVFMNIITNALDEMEKKPVPRQLIITTQKILKNQIQVKIKDNGLGMSEKVKQHLFDPFFTTKPVGKGTGLGLSIAYQIIQKHQGSIEVNSVLGEGTEFLIYLPV